ncbi:MAG: tetratricopeptide repeat protein [Chloroflexota bacterium]
MPRLCIACLGSFRATMDDQPISCEIDKARALLAYLAVNKTKSHHRQHLAGLFWSDQPEKNALHCLRQTLSGLRKSLGEDADSPEAGAFLLISRQEIQFNPDSDHWIDVHHFTHGLQQAYHAPATQGRLAGVDIRRVQKALALYQGPFLDQFYLSGSALFEEWCIVQREAYNRLAIEALSLVSEYHERRQEYSLAREAAEKLARLAPWDETVHAQVLRLMAIDQQWSAAWNYYHSQRNYLEQELGVSLAQELVDLFEEIRKAVAQNQPLAPRFPPSQVNLPAAATAFVGRQCELDAISEAFSEPGCRLTSLVGIGGVGKTRLALEASREQVGLFRHGVFWVPLAGLESPEALVFALADALGFQFYGNDPPQAQLVNYLRNKEALLVLDNFEHLISPGASQKIPSERGPGQAANAALSLVISLLESAAGVKLLVTSRQPLELRAECVLAITGLDTSQDMNHIEASDSNALALFELTARQAWPKFAFNEQKADAARICKLLEGIPLAIELAAAWTQIYSCAEIAQMIENDLGFIATSMGDVPERHRSLRTVFQHSWELLSPMERYSLARLAIFRGGCTHQAAAQIANATSQVLKTLISKSLVLQSAPGRYDLHSLVRQFAAEELAAAASTERQARRRHARFFSNLLASHTRELQSRQELKALSILSPEEDNLRVAWATLVEQGDITALADSLDGMFLFYEIRSHLLEGIEIFNWSADQIGGDGSLSAETQCFLGRLLARLAMLYMRIGKYERAGEGLARSQELLLTSCDEKEMGFFKLAYSKLLRLTSDYAASSEYAAQALALFQKTTDDIGQARASFELGKTAYRLGEITAARQHLENSLAISRQAGGLRIMGEALNTLADILCHLGDFDHAYLLFEESLSISQDLGDQYNLGVLLNNMGTVEQARQKFDAAERLFNQSLEICSQIGDEIGEAIALGNLGEIANERRDFSSARMFGQQELLIGQKLQDDWAKLSGFNVIAEAAMHQKDIQTAWINLVEALKLSSETQTLQMLARTLVIAAGVLIEQGNTNQALAILSATLHHPACQIDYCTKAQTWLQQAGLPYPPAGQRPLEEISQELISQYTGITPHLAAPKTS